MKYDVSIFFAMDGSEQSMVFHSNIRFFKHLFL
jgi:hypothetical protein